MTGRARLKNYIPDVKKAFNLVVESKEKYYIWNGNELIQEMNKNLGHYKIHNVNQLVHVFRVISSHFKFKRYDVGLSCSQYLFIKKPSCKKS